MRQLNRISTGYQRFDLTASCRLYAIYCVPLSSTSLPRPLLRDEVEARLRAAIIDGTLAPGEQLRDQEIAAQLGVSRTPVREALLELSRSGLVRTLPGRSTVVAPVEDEEVCHARDVVAAMHRLAARVGTPRLTPHGLAEMRRHNDEFRAAHARGDVEASLISDDAFHGILIEACGNDAIRTVLALYQPVLLRAERLRFSSAHEALTSAERHDALIAACESGDATAAAEIAEGIWMHLIPTTPTSPHPAGSPHPDKDTPA